jgi:hypothetical protein
MSGTFLCCNDFSGYNSSPVLNNTCLRSVVFAMKRGRACTYLNCPPDLAVYDHDECFWYGFCVVGLVGHDILRDRVCYLRLGGDTVIIDYRRT